MTHGVTHVTIYAVKNDDVFRFWAKLNRAKTHWHSNLQHCIDVGNVAKAILLMDPKLCRYFCKALKMTKREVLEFVPFFISLHDVGKISSPFQDKIPELSKWIDKNKYPPFAGDPRGIRHELVSRYILHELVYHPNPSKESGGPRLLGTYVDGDKSALLEFAAILSTHHGHFFKTFGSSIQSVVAGSWLEAQTNAANLLFKIFRPSGNKFKLALKGSLSTRLSVMLAGFLIESDWVASNLSVSGDGFRFAFRVNQTGIMSEADLRAYAEESLKTAQRVVSEELRLHIRTKKTEAPNKTFEEMFGFSPRPLQQTCVNLIADGTLNPRKQFFLMINDATGSGKTEAAIFISEKAGVGENMSLPTMATTDAMAERRVRYIDRIHEDKSVTFGVSHSTAFFSSVKKKLVQKTASRDEEPDDFDDETGALTTEFFSSSKKSLLADYCICTLDQVAMAVIPTKHIFLRLFALAGKTIIIDEVHSYSTYTQIFIYELIRWLKLLGCNVVILSATITSLQKKKLIAAWDESVNFSDADAARYPSIICVQDSNASSSIR